MVRLFFSDILMLALAFSAFSQTVPPQPISQTPIWVAPAPRIKEKTIFSPKPFPWNNIFKGDGEKWLADAIVKVEAGNFTAIKDKEISDYVALVGNNLLKYSRTTKKQFDFVVLDDREVDAMNIGDGRVYINLGTLKAVDSEDELAGIIAHEIGHDAFGHIGKTVTRQLFWMKGIEKVNSPEETEKALSSLDEAYRKNTFATFGEALLGWSRGNEAEADKAAFYTIYKAGYNPLALADAFRRFVKAEKAQMGDDYDAFQFLTFLLGDHPPSSDRVNAVKWESNWVKMPPKDVRYKSAAFDAMKARVAKM